ncbi:glutamine--fructose-6-phosphate transaminase (isomerizing) [Anaerotruncus rubiinfantis]|uniref:glutamine--fructose-6-phosphate transaminase (isomerizing) n=1 Tax=Anaerotruncus rubiinfantis TaxID=1720200 RepID=UPI00189B4AAD|nr:glutamine--fructose-6-phosphate transaminase (isomerizing) [Anaerotruncus rubiinfantis]
MCGIVGYAGRKHAASVLLNALSGLEYRGYDSAGISVFSGESILTVKAKGRLQCLADRLKDNPAVERAVCGIGHTRWATHGEPSDVNAHPHATEKLSLVHNGIIENYQQLRSQLAAKGYEFLSRTDTEVAAKLIDSLYDGDPVGTIRRACALLEGSYAFAIVFADRPGEVYATRLGSPLIAAKGDGENFLASDVPAILQYTRDYCLIAEGQIVKVTQDRIALYQADGSPAPVEMLRASWTVEQAQKGGYEHFMLKEIYEQPRALADTVHPRILDGLPSFEGQDDIPEGFWKQFDRVSIVACGTAWHAGMVGKYLIERLARIPVECSVASEFRYCDPILSKRTLVIVISQSGETADTLAALRLAQQKGTTTLAVVNVTGSSIAREADYVIHTFAGPEIAVASTKAYSVQLSVMYMIAVKLALCGGKISADTARDLTDGLLEAVGAAKEALALDDEIKAYVQRYEALKDLFFLGRGLDYALSMEGSLKLKEVSYIHCEAYAAGELKHGTISLITPGVPVVAMATQEVLLPKMVSNIKEVHSRGADVLLIGKKGLEIDPEIYGRRFDLPALDDLFMPIPGVVVLQLLAYHTAVLRGCDVDKPRNLAKSVTVE